MEGSLSGRSDNCFLEGVSVEVRREVLILDGFVLDKVKVVG